MKEIIIQAYQYHELHKMAKQNVVRWLDEYPVTLPYDNEKGEEVIQYFSEMDEGMLEEHCESNGYLFNKRGDPVHHLEKETDPN
jgi:hypothetical protein